MEKLRQFIYGIIAGIGIGIGGIVFLSVDNSVIGSFLFGIGLLTVLFFNLQLFTGKIGYFVFNKLNYGIELIITWAGNFVGTYLAALAIRNTRVFDKFDAVYKIAEVKLGDSPLSVFILAVFCGILMFVAVDIFKTSKEGTVKVIGVLFPVSVFILSGFEHCVANMFYFSLAEVWNIKSFFYIIIMTLGNSVGGLIIPSAKKVFEK